MKKYRSIAGITLLIIGLLVVGTLYLHEQNRERISPHFTPSVRYWEEQIIFWADTYDLDPNFVATVMQIESCGNPELVGGSGESGLFQVMPLHFKEGENALNTTDNFRRGVGYLSSCYDQADNDIPRTLICYNQGGGALTKDPEDLPDWTKRYIYYGEPMYLHANAPTDSAVQRWKTKWGGNCPLAEELLGVKTQG